MAYARALKKSRITCITYSEWPLRELEGTGPLRFVFASPARGAALPWIRFSSCSGILVGDEVAFLPLTVCEALGSGLTRGVSLGRVRNTWSRFVTPH